MLPVLSAPSPAMGKGVDPGLPRLTGLCRDPAGAVGRAHVCADGPLSAHARPSTKSDFFFSFSVEIFLC
jgi:hypothetical protein